MKNNKEIVEEMGTLNEIKYIYTKNHIGTTDVALDFSNCPTLTEQHSINLTNINYLMDKYKPDELAAFIAARNQYRQEIIGHDFSREPSLQDAKTLAYQLKQEFENLPNDIKSSFKNHVEFLKFIDNPANQEKMIKLGILKPKQIEKLLPPTNDNDPNLKPNDNATTLKT